jgi:esterase/lipase superfamily enzyme
VAIFGHYKHLVILFPTSMEKYHENKNLSFIESPKWYIEHGPVQLFYPNSIYKDSFYNNQIYPIHHFENHVRYDKMICYEIVEKVKHNSQSSKVAIAGCSFGGYHAANFACRHP